MIFLYFISYFVTAAEIQPCKEDVCIQLYPYIILFSVIFYLRLAPPK